MKKMFPVFALGALMMFVASCEKDTEFENKEEPGTENTDTFLVEAVDLGLSVKWASCNVGADSPEDSGNYYAWGEIEEKSDYCWDNYEYYLGDLDGDMRVECVDLGSDISGTLYDVARVKWCDGWRMPSKVEIEELFNRCKWEWSLINGIYGQKVIGPNGNSIFLPATGYRDEDGLQSYGYFCYYWSSSRDELSVGSAYYFYSGRTQSNIVATDRKCGQAIRPVKD